MNKEANILIADDNKEHFELIRKNLLWAGVYNETHNFADGRQLLDFLFDTDKYLKEEQNNQEYILLLDLNIPGIGGVELLEKIKRDTKLKKIPVIILTTADDPNIIERCHNLGCSTYIVKPAEYNDFEKTIQKIGHFLSVVEITSTK